MQRSIILTALFLTAAGCAAAERTAFDPEIDERIGAEVREACFFSTGGPRGGYQRVGDRDAFVTGEFNKSYLLVFSRGCGDLRPGGAFPVFRNYGDNCRRRGELVQTARTDFGVSGACTIQHIYEWDRKKDEPEETEAG